MQTIFLFLCQLQLQSPYPQFPGWLLWKLPQPKSWKGKDGLRERETLEASVVQGGKERDKPEVDDRPSNRLIHQRFLIPLCAGDTRQYIRLTVNLSAYF